jgi:DNA invertase Pin-like site-specific DNA recombinase
MFAEFVKTNQTSGVVTGFERTDPPAQRCLVDADFAGHGRYRPASVDHEHYGLVFVPKSELPACLSPVTILSCEVSTQGGQGQLIGHARVSARQQSTARQQVDILASGVRRDDVYVDREIPGSRTSRPYSARALDSLEAGDTLVITALDRLGRWTQNMLAFAEELRARGAGLRVLNPGGDDDDTATPMGSMLFTIMAALGQMEHEINRERVIDSINKPRDAGKNLGGRPRLITDSQTRNVHPLVKGGETAAQVALDLGMSRATFYRWARVLGLLPDQPTNDTLTPDRACVLLIVSHGR